MCLNGARGPIVDEPLLVELALFNAVAGVEGKSSRSSL